MPLYDFECPNCKHVHEKLCKLNVEQEISCPKCGQSIMKKLITSSYMINMPTGKSVGKENYS